MTVAVLGEALIDLIVGDDGRYEPHLGGSPYNVAVALARQDVDVAYLSPFSDDQLGEQLRASLASEGVRLPVTRRSALPTSLALISLDANGAPDYRLYRQGIADKDTTYDEIVANLPAETALFHTGSLAITPSQQPRMLRLFEFLREHEVLISMDVNIRARATQDHGRYIDGARQLMRYCDIVKVSDEDLDALDFHDDLPEAATLAIESMDGGLLVLTEGANGAQILTQQGRMQCKAPRVDEVVDTIGAGDTFHACFLAGILSAADPDHGTLQLSKSVLESALAYACAGAAINVARAGCNPPTQAEVRQFMGDS